MGPQDNYVRTVVTRRHPTSAGYHPLRSRGGAARGQLAAAGEWSRRGVEQAAPAGSGDSVAALLDPLSMLLLGPLRAVGVLLEVAEVRVPSDLSALVAGGIKQAPRVSVAGPSRPFPDKSGPAAEPYGSQPATLATECPQVARLGVGRRGSPHRGSSSLFPESAASPVGCPGDMKWFPTDVDSAAPLLADYTKVWSFLNCRRFGLSQRCCIDIRPANVSRRIHIQIRIVSR
jgi:hypothetical protein